MYALATLLTLVNQVSGTPYVVGGDSPAGTDCSGLVSWVTNAATDRPVYGDRFHTGNIESALLARGFQYGSAPDALVVGWNSGHTALTLPDGTPVSSGEGGSGVKVGGGGAYQGQFSNHMFLPMPANVPPESDPLMAPLMGPPPLPVAPPAPPPGADPLAPPPPGAAPPAPPPPGAAPLLPPPPGAAPPVPVPQSPEETIGLAAPMTPLPPPPPPGVPV
ncbi:MAG: peptidoglycan endopeptidase [Mycobacterium sp.]